MKLLTVFLLVLVLSTVSCSDIEPTRRFVSLAKRVKPADEKFPYQVGMLLKESDSTLSWCGGSLIGHIWVLTAAHCMEDIEEATLYFGATQHQSSKITYKVKKENFIIHSDWDSYNLKHDIALVKTPYITYSRKVQPVKLPSFDVSNFNHNDEEAITSGWGHISDSSADLSNKLDWSSMYVIRNDLCSEYFGSAISPSHICVSTYGLASNCTGDTGGPLVLKSNRVQIGVSSFGSRKGCEKAVPSVFTRVTKYLQWIQNNTGILN